MTTKDIDDLYDRLEDLLYGNGEGLLLKYHNGKGLDKELYDRLFEYLQEFKDACKNKSYVPKKIVHLIMQAVPGLYSDIGLYSGDEILHEEYHALIYRLDTAVLMSINPDANDPHSNTPLKDL